MQLMRLLPKSALSNLVGRLTRAPVPASVHQLAIRRFAEIYGVDLDEAESGVDEYSTFGQFFTRRLKAGARRIDEGTKSIVSPADSAVSQVGTIDGGCCVQAKGIHFSVARLLGDEAAAAAFENGVFITLYLSPRDYHRFHSPVAGKVVGYRYLPGEFWPVNAASVRLKEALFAVNERLVTHLSSEAGRVAYVAVGATCVARIHASYESIVTHRGEAAHAHTYARPIEVERGGELGMFEMGSTVIMLFESGRVRLDERLKPGTTVRVGERIGVFT
jgi:phosphatidylserine decarboxylase